jgi:hypothetical protein
LEDQNVEISEYDMKTGFKNTIEKWEPSRINQTQLDTRKRYFSVVHAYLRRQLTYESDILDAIAGIHDHFAEQAELTIHYGIPENTFGCDVFWQSGGVLQRRLPHPSWSWVGWKGFDIRFNVNDSFIHQDRSQQNMSDWIAWHKWSYSTNSFEDMSLKETHIRSLKPKQKIMDTVRALIEVTDGRESTSSSNESQIPKQVLPAMQLQSISSEYKSQALKAPGAILIRTLTSSVVMSHDSNKEQRISRTITESVESLPTLPWFGSLTRSKTEQVSKALGNAKLDTQDALQTIWRPNNLPGSKLEAYSQKEFRIAIISGPLRPSINTMTNKSILRVLLLYELPADFKKNYILTERVGVGEIWTDTTEQLNFEETNVILH